MAPEPSNENAARRSGPALLSAERKSRMGNYAVVILGASGDLARRKLVPALQVLYNRGNLDGSAFVVGLGRTPFTDESFRARFALSAPFAERLFYHQYVAGLKKYLSEKGSFSRIIFFLAQPPEAYAATARELHAEGFGKESSLIIEKPFGYDYRSASELNKALAACFDESAIFRIDHYLAKEAVQNILVFRFANALFYPVWNSRYLSSIQINALEEIGVNERGGYFDKAGIIRDMVQNHLLQLLSLLTMEAPVSLAANDIIRQKIDLLRTVTVAEAHRFQYHGYRAEKGIAHESTTDTYAELKLFINNFRWSGMPVYIRTGKGTNRRGTEIGIRFKPLPRVLFNMHGDLAPNRIIFKIQPAEGIIVDLSTKLPGSGDVLAGTHLNFCYRDAFPSAIPEAYQRLIADATAGDRTLFVSAEETETAWRLLDGVLDKGDIGFYDRGTLPQSKLDAAWIDFEKYATLCD